MYRHCIFCSAGLGANEAVEAFPVGRTLAFDAAKGRLWAVCPRCGRWNLAPLEERWDAIEAAEKRFRDARLRVHSENVGLAKAADGTRLVRVGDAVPGEVAAWRYGRQMQARRWRHGLITVVGGGAGAAYWLGAMMGTPLVAAAPLAGAYALWRDVWNPNRGVASISAADSPTGAPLVVQRRHLTAARLRLPRDRADRFALEMHVAPRQPWHRFQWMSDKLMVRLAERQALPILRRGMVHVNGKGASAGLVDDAVELLARHGAEGWLREAPRSNLALVGDARTGAMERHELLAVEMALHEEDERRALAGELTLLQSAWREAESIARIADALPGDPPPPEGL